MPRLAPSITSSEVLAGGRRSLLSGFLLCLLSSGLKEPHCSSTIPWHPLNVLQFNVGFCWPQNRTQHFRRGRIMSDNNDNNQQRDIITPLHLLFVIAQKAAGARCKLHLQLVSTTTISSFSAELLLVLWQGVSLPLTSLSPC